MNGYDAAEDYEDDDDVSGGRCGPCAARAGGLLLAVLGGGLLWMGADLLTGGAVTRAVFGGSVHAPGPLAADNGEQDDELSETEDASGDPATSD